ncbi:MAG: histidine phosphatase family protein [Mycobacteriaceae bacterium]|nr:histidine phosphatase family protein [Mycobacteriaceae bacterium]
MTLRVTLVAPPSPPPPEVRFGGDYPLNDAQRFAVAELRSGLPAVDRVIRGPELRCRDTAALLDEDAAIEAELRDLAYGAWTGHSPEHVITNHPDQFQAWHEDSAVAPPGGESIDQLVARVTAFLDALSAAKGRVLAVTSTAVIRAAVLATLGAPGPSFWRVDVEPLSAVHLTGFDGRWNLRL